MKRKSDKKKINVAIADDHQVVLIGLKTLLSKADDIEVVGAAFDGEELIQLVESGLDIDVVLMDINMPRINGIEATKYLNKEHSHINVLAITVNEDEASIKKMLNAGALGYILKDDDEQDIMINAIRKVCKGESYFSNKVSSVLLSKYMTKHPSNMKVEPNLDTDLTDREVQILRLIAQEKTSTEIADNLFLSIKTVEMHRSNLIKKIGVRSSIGLIKYAVKLKLIE